MTTSTTPREAERQFRAQGFSRKAAKTAVAGLKLQGVFLQQPKQSIITRIYNIFTGESSNGN